MADFPFAPKPIGNFCFKCCEDCILKTGDPEAGCCESLSGSLKECYSPKLCFECQDNPPDNKKVVNKCTDPKQSYLYNNETSCCNGTCYDNRCFKCENNKVVPDYNPDIEICCGGARRSIKKDYKDCCKKCKTTDASIVVDNKTINYKIVEVQENYCTENNTDKDCCYGSCWNSSQDGICKTCNDTTQKVDEKCPPVDNAKLIACCGGECWAGADADECQECVQIGQNPNGQPVLALRPKDGCNCCSNPAGTHRSCCPPAGSPSKTSCCSTTGECYNPDCERCD